MAASQRLGVDRALRVPYGRVAGYLVPFCWKWAHGLGLTIVNRMFTIAA